jgi:hypothetical protein
MFNQFRAFPRWSKTNRGHFIVWTVNGCLLFIVALATAALSSCQKRVSFDPTLAGAFFPLQPGSRWTYKIIDESRGTTEIVTDHAVGKEYVKTLKAFGAAVSEASEGSGLADPGGSRFVYVSEGGFINRAADLDGAAWIRFEERRFLPQLLKPNLTWSNILFPFGEAQGLYAIQHHRTFLEADDVVVPAGHFSGCIRIETETVYQNDISGQTGALHLRYIDWYAANVGLVKTRVVKGGYIDHYAANLGLVRTLLSKSGLFNSEIARLELLSFAKSQVEAAPSAKRWP